MVQAAVAWAVKVAMHLSETYGINTQVQTNVGGPVNQVHWASTFENLAQVDEVVGQLPSDEAYASLVADGMEQGLFDGQSIEDRFYRSVP
jgi:hypothetical protein